MKIRKDWANQTRCCNSFKCSGAVCGAERTCGPSHVVLLTDTARGDFAPDLGLTVVLDVRRFTTDARCVLEHRDDDDE